MARREGVQPEMIAWRQRQLNTRAQEHALGQIVVTRKPRSVRHSNLRRETEGIEAVHRADIAAPVCDFAQRRRIAAVVSLRAVRQTDVIPVTRRQPRRVRTREEPGRDVALRQRAMHRPIRLPAHRRREREMGNAAREVVGRKQLPRTVERTGCQQIHLTREGNAGKQIRRETRGRAARLTSRRFEGIYTGWRTVSSSSQKGVRHGDVFQDAAAQMLEAPRRFAVIVVNRRRVGGCDGGRIREG